MKLIVGIYNPPELFPPTLWAVQELSNIASEITIVTRNIEVEPWPFAGNVNTIRIGRKTKLHEQLSAVKKTADFIKFSSRLRKVIRQYSGNENTICLAYDSIALFAFYLIGKTGSLKDKQLWYHSHDVAEVQGLSKLSVSWWAAHYENKALGKVNLFTLPSRERMKYFDLQHFKGKVFIIPNYPSGKFLSRLRLPPKDFKSTDTVKLIYQGSISRGHCLEQVIEALGSAAGGSVMELTLIGWCRQEYRELLQNLAVRFGVQDRVHFKDPVPYQQLYEITAAHHIGLAIHKPENIIYSTGGTASNKIYEYAAVGLPVILYDNQHFREYCGRFGWTVFTDGTPGSIRQCVAEITGNYQNLSLAALSDFRNELNYEHTFGGFAQTALG